MSNQPLTTGAGKKAKQCDRSVSVALGGGGGRGITHLGVLQALAESGMKIDRICGTSIGAIAGAMFAADPAPERNRSKVLAFINSPQFRRRQAQMFGSTSSRGRGAMTTGWLSKFKRIFKAHQSMTRAIRHAAILPETLLQHVVDTLLPEVDIERMPVPFSVLAVDLKSGQRHEIDRGPLRTAVRASASIPGVFPPVPYDGMLLADIGVFESVPTTTAKRYAKDLTLAVDVSECVVPIEGCKNILEVFSRVQHLAECELRQHSLAHADFVIRPDIGRRAWFDFSSPEELISMGHEATTKTLAEVSTSRPTPIFSAATTTSVSPPVIR